jgi:PBP1b-binding outer membrane lipoprotein LpoB
MNRNSAAEDPSMKTIYRWLAICPIGILALLLVGCASEVGVHRKASSSEPTQSQYKSRYKVVAVNVVSDGKSEDTIDQLSSAIVSKLRGTGAFGRVLSKSATLEKQFDLVVSVTPTKYQNQDIAQAWVGILGGRSAIEIQVTLLDETTSRTIASGTIEAKAPVKLLLFSSSSMALAIDFVGEEVARFVLENI